MYYPLSNKLLNPFANQNYQPFQQTFGDFHGTVPTTNTYRSAGNASCTQSRKNSDETEQLQQDPETTDAAMQLVSLSHQSVETLADSLFTL